MAAPTFQSATTNTATAASSITVSSVPAGTNQLYLFFVSWRDNSITVTSVTNTGGLTFVSQKRQCGARGVGTIEVFQAVGSPGAAFNITANFSGSPPASLAAVLRYSSADMTTPTIDATGENTNAENDATCTGGTDDAAAQLTLTSVRDESLHIGGTNQRNRTISTPDAEYTVRVNDISAGSGGDNQHLSVHEKELNPAALDQMNHTLSSTTDWCTAGLVIQPPAGGKLDAAPFGMMSGGIVER